MNPHLPMLLREARKSVGMTQSELARYSKVSLPTIQNIEANKGNPSLATLESLFQALGLEFTLEVKAADWDLLATCGVPLLSKRRSNKVPSAEVLIQGLRGACLELATKSSVDDRERKKEALQATLLALKSHYPTFFIQYCQTPLVLSFLPREISGQLIKLKRQAAAVLATYL